MRPGVTAAVELGRVALGRASGSEDDADVEDEAAVAVVDRLDVAGGDAVGQQDGVAQRKGDDLDVPHEEVDPCDVEMTLAALADHDLANQIFVVRDGAEALDYLFCREKFKTQTANQMVIGSMEILEQAKWVARVDDKSEEGRGVALWVINPALKDMFATRRSAIMDAKRRAEERRHEVAAWAITYGFHFAIV